MLKYKILSTEGNDSINLGPILKRIETNNLSIHKYFQKVEKINMRIEELKERFKLSLEEPKLKTTESKLPSLYNNFSEKKSNQDNLKKIVGIEKEITANVLTLTRIREYNQVHYFTRKNTTEAVKISTTIWKLNKKIEKIEKEIDEIDNDSVIKLSPSSSDKPLCGLGSIKTKLKTTETSLPEIGSSKMKNNFSEVLKNSSFDSDDDLFKSLTLKKRFSKEKDPEPISLPRIYQNNEQVKLSDKTISRSKKVKKEGYKERRCKSLSKRRIFAEKKQKKMEELKSKQEELSRLRAMINSGLKSLNEKLNKKMLELKKIEREERKIPKSKSKKSSKKYPSYKNPMFQINIPLFNAENTLLGFQTRLIRIRLNNLPKSTTVITANTRIDTILKKTNRALISADEKIQELEKIKIELKEFIMPNQTSV